ncbi:hypothetical protein AB3R30_02975 [Leptolyngbyaceae cyanobacterium UHCC 1019]
MLHPYPVTIKIIITLAEAFTGVHCAQDSEWLKQVAIARSRLTFLILGLL